LSVPVIATTTCADFRCAQGPFRGLHLSASPPTGHHGPASPRPPNAGAQTDLSCSMLGCAHVPLPLRRTVLPGCISKIFTRSMAFAQWGKARLRLLSAAKRRDVSRRCRIRFRLRTACSLDPQRGLCRGASTHRISPRAGHQLHGCLVTTVAGPPPASRTQLPGRTPIEHLVAGPSHGRSWTKVRLGARAQTDPVQRAHAPPAEALHTSNPNGT
jgi:hypothetical protein